MIAFGSLFRTKESFLFVVTKPATISLQTTGCTSSVHEATCEATLWTKGHLDVSFLTEAMWGLTVENFHK
jgi:hypothetical protein